MMTASCTALSEHAVTQPGSSYTTWCLDDKDVTMIMSQSYVSPHVLSHL